MLPGQPFSGLRRRHLLGLLTAAAALSLPKAFAAQMPAGSPAEIPIELQQAAAMSPAAAFGLFNNVVLAGPRLVAVGERGRIMLSDDAGNSWRQVPVPISSTLVSARFATPALGWAVGQMGVILKTADGGESWKLVLNGFQAANLMLAEAQSGGAKPVKAVSQPAADGAGQAALQNAQLLVTFGAATPMLSLLVLGPDHVIAFGAFGLALESLDAGETWSGIAARMQNTQGLHVYGALQTASTLVVVGEAGLLLHGPLAGSLAAAASPYPGSLFGLVSPAPDNILAFGLQGTLLQSADLGATWRSLPVVSSNAVLCGALLADGRIVLGDASGNLLVSKNGGGSFHVNPGTFPVTALAQAPDGALILGSPVGLRRLMLEASA
jgi:photosystem II stability/assembly factor-like uncharacterized protein